LFAHVKKVKKVGQTLFDNLHVRWDRHWAERTREIKTHKQIHPSLFVFLTTVYMLSGIVLLATVGTLVRFEGLIIALLGTLPFFTGFSIAYRSHAMWKSTVGFVSVLVGIGMTGGAIIALLGATQPSLQLVIAISIGFVCQNGIFMAKPSLIDFQAPGILAVGSLVCAYLGTPPITEVFGYSHTAMSIPDWGAILGTLTAIASLLRYMKLHGLMVPDGIPDVCIMYVVAVGNAWFRAARIYFVAPKPVNHHEEKAVEES